MHLTMHSLADFLDGRGAGSGAASAAGSVEGETTDATGPPGLQPTICGTHAPGGAEPAARCILRYGTAETGTAGGSAADGFQRRSAGCSAETSGSRHGQ